MKYTPTNCTQVRRTTVSWIMTESRKRAGRPFGAKGSCWLAKIQAQHSHRSPSTKNFKQACRIFRCSNTWVPSFSLCWRCWIILSSHCIFRWLVLEFRLHLLSQTLMLLSKLLAQIRPTEFTGFKGCNCRRWSCHRIFSWRIPQNSNPRNSPKIK